MSWIQEHANPHDILNHMSNIGIYGSEDTDLELVESLKTNGVMIPGHCVRNSEGRLVALDGHRRKNAARVAGMDSIPIRVWQGEMSHEQQVIWIVEANRQRTKSNEQKAREGKALSEAYSVQAANRELVRKSTTAVMLPVSMDVGTKGESREKAAKVVGISRKTLDAGVASVNAIDDAELTGDHAFAATIREALRRGPNAAAKLVRGKKQGPKIPRSTSLTETNGDPPVGPMAESRGHVEWVIKTVVPRIQEYARLVVRRLGNQTRTFRIENIDRSAALLHKEFRSIQREIESAAEQERIQSN